MSRLSGSSICKDIRSWAQHSHQVFYYFTSWFSINKNNTEQASVLQTKTLDQHKRPTQLLFLTMYKSPKNVLSPLIILPCILKPQPFHPYLHHLCQNISLTLHSTEFIFSWKPDAVEREIPLNFSSTDNSNAVAREEPWRIKTVQKQTK